MARFSQIAKGTRARRPIELVLWDGIEAKVDMRPILAFEEADAIAAAHVFCKGRGQADAKAGDELFELGRMANVLAIGCVDPDSAPDAPVAFFDGGAAQIVKELDRDRIAFLFERHQEWQDECSPTPARLQGDDFMSALVEAATTEDERPFARWRRSTLLSFMRTTARLLLNSQKLQSPSTSDSEPSSSAAS